MRSHVIGRPYYNHAMNLVQIVPGLLPKFDGIGDYAMQFARRLRENHGIHTSFIVGDPAWDGGEVEGFFATKVGARTCNGLLDALERCERVCRARATFQLFSTSRPTATRSRGYPLWLQRSLDEWQRRRPNTLNIVFHELDVHCSRPWSSAFWVAPLQRNLIKHVARTGGFKYTNTEQHRSQLESLGSGRMALIHNISTIGEPPFCRLFQRDGSDIIIFGRGAQRKANYSRGSDVLSSLCRLIGAERIIDIGDPIAGETTTHIEGVPIVRCGRLEMQEISTWMSTSVASFYRVSGSSAHQIFGIRCKLRARYHSLYFRQSEDRIVVSRACVGRRLCCTDA